MGRSTSPGRNVRAKAGLNRAIADSAWGELRELLTYKLEERGGHTSQTCAECGYRGAENRPSRALFACAACGHQAHADVNAARVIARRGEEKLYGSGETRVEDAAMAAPAKPNPLPPSDPARAVATPSGADRDFHLLGSALASHLRLLATPSGAVSSKISSQHPPGRVGISTHPPASRRVPESRSVRSHETALG